ncbi:MAG TPA: hypothetical protein H9985_00395 [Candidatus Anaerofilum faecale]|nr:hypothetical protein [Candidatus Anaerofilum faecale]
MLFRFVRGCFQTLLLWMLLLVPLTVEAILTGGVAPGMGLLRLVILVLGIPLVKRMAFRRRPCRRARQVQRPAADRPRPSSPKTPRAA